MAQLELLLQADGQKAPHDLPATPRSQRHSGPEHPGGVQRQPGSQAPRGGPMGWWPLPGTAHPLQLPADSCLSWEGRLAGGPVPREGQ